MRARRTRPRRGDRGSAPRTLGRRPAEVCRTSPGRISPLHNVPVTTTLPLEHERAVDGQACQIIPPFLHRFPANASRASSRSSTPSPVAPLTDHGGTHVPRLEQVLDIQGGQVHGLLVYGIDFRERDDPCSTRMRRMSRCSLVWGMTPSSAATTSRKASTPVAPETMFLTKRSWPGTSTRLARLPSEDQLRVPRHDGDTPAVFLFQTVGIRARHVTDERGLAVVHMPRRPMVRDILCSPSSPMRVPEGPDHGFLVARQERPHVQP